MNGEPNANPQVPVTTLAGIASLTNLLPELPLPSSSVGVGDSRSLLFHPRVAEEAQRLLSCQDSALVEQLANSLALTHADHIELKEQYASQDSSINAKSAPPLLEGILRLNPAVFSGKKGGEAGLIVKTEGGKTGGTPNHSASSRLKQHINNVSVIQCGPALVNATQVRIKTEPGGQPPETVNKDGDQQGGQPGLIQTVTLPSGHPRSNLEVPPQVNEVSANPSLQGDKNKEKKKKTGSNHGNKKESSHHVTSKEKEKVPHNHTGHKSKDNANAVARTMKEPVVVLNKLSSEELKSMSRIHTYGGIESNNKSNKHADTPLSKRNSSAARSGRSRKDTRKYREVSSESESEEDDKKKPNKYFKNREREREEKKKKDKADRKRNRTYSDDDDFDPDQEKKRRRKGGRESDEEEEDSDYAESESKGNRRSGAPIQVTLTKPTYTNKRLERKLVAQTEKLSPEELMETGVYQRFTRAVEKIFDNTDDLDVNAEIEEDDDVPQEYLIPKYELTDLCSETAKLKSLGAMAIVPPERLVRLLNILEKNIRDGTKVTPVMDDDDEDDDKLWMELVMERILRGVDSSLTAMYIMTSPNMNKRVYLEDVIERCVQFTKFQLSNTIYPSFDPVYRVDGKKDGYVGSMKRKRAQCKDVRNRSILGLYNKLHEVVGLLADLLNIQTLTDTTVLQLSTLGVGPFFVENVSELQLSALRLVTKVFSKYNKHRRLLLDDILASIARLPNSKRSLRTYRLNSDENIQMLTALVLQLIQCVVELPEELTQAVSGNKSESDSQNSKDSKVSKDAKDAKVVGEKKSELNMDRDVLICNRYETAMSTAYSFLSVFLQKTGSKNEEIDYRPLFENFVQDLLITVNKPEWPASELLLSLLGKLLVQKFSNTKTDMTLRVSSLDCLGVVAAKLRRDAVSSNSELEQIKSIILDVKEEENRDAPMLEDGTAPLENGTAPTPTPTTTSSKKSKKKKKGASEKPKENGIPIPNDEEEERTRFLQRVLLDWLAVNSGSETALLHARHFYIGQWYREAYTEILRQKQGPLPPTNTRKSGSHNKRKRKRKGNESEEESEATEEDDEDEERKKGHVDEALVAEVTQLSEKRKLFLIKKIAAFPPASPGAKTQTLQTHIGYDNAELITKYLASKRPFSQSFDMYLKQILRVLTESAIAVRTKAMKCLTMVVEADPSVLSRSDMQMGVHHSFLDHSTSVREAAVDLVGKFVLCRPEVLNTYYEMIAARILDTGVSVRKRVIKILKDICLECPDFMKIPEICVKMIRRVNDEEGIKKLVQEVFQNMWFTPVKERPQVDEEALLRKVNNITEVVVACRDTGLDWFEQLLHSMFRPKEDKDDVTKINTEPPKSLISACKQIVDCLVRHILVLEEGGGSGKENHSSEEPEEPKTTSERLLACLKTLYLFAKIRPHLLIEHAITLQPYLAWKCRTQVDYTMIGVVARTLELVVPLMEHPSETFLSQLEEDAVKLILQHDRTVITSCLGLLGSIVNTVTKNYRLIRDCFIRYHSFIADYKKLNEDNPKNPKLESYKPFFRRALYTIGLLLKHFDLKNENVRCGLPGNITEQVFEMLMYFMDLPDMNLRYCTLQAMGFVAIRHYELMMGHRLKQLYHMLLLDPAVSTQLRIQTLQNVETYLQEEEVRMIKQDQEWAKLKTRENLKEMCDVQSGMASAIIQMYLKQVLECVVAGCVVVRHSALRVIQLVLAQGLVHPVQIVPYLVCMSTDSEEAIAHSADKQLQDIEKKYPGFIGMKAMQGFRLSYRLHTLIQEQPPTRGFRSKEGEHPGALNGFLYSIMRSTKQHRRAVAFSLMKQFEEQARSSLSELLFIADNLAYFPYQVIDEPLFIIHHIDIMISVTGTNILSNFREALLPPPNPEVKINPETGQEEYVDDLDDEEDIDVYLSRLPPCLSPLEECMNSCQGCLLLLMIKDYMKEIYGITDGRITQYSPSDTSKQYEKACTRKSTARFNPKQTLKSMREEVANPVDSEEEDTQPKIDLVSQYLNFRSLMLKIDPDDDDDSDNEPSQKVVNNENDPPAAPNTRTLRGHQNGSDVPLLPGTHDGWKEPPKEEEGTVQTLKTVPEDQVVEEIKVVEPLPPRRTPTIKPITIRASQVTNTREHRSHRSSHKSSSHKKHKKKKKKKARSDSDEESEFSDPDFLV